MRPTVALCMIMKDEVHNLPRLFESVRGCFDEIHVTDTGSRDGSQEWVKEHGARVSESQVSLHHFDWIQDFAAARNYSFSHTKCDFIVWLDLDDCLHNREAFIKWRDHAMQFADGWYVNYHYAVDQNHNPVITFIRERVVKNDGSFKWQYFIHEGLVPQRQGLSLQVINTWSIKHLRSEEDFAKDRRRNVEMLAARREQLPSRLLFYYGKELHDAGDPEKALPVLMDACIKPDLETHDRILGLQYACYSAMQLADRMKPEFQAEKFMLAEKLAKQGLELAANRAEFFCIIGDSLVRRGKFLEALPYFQAATGCVRADEINPSAVQPIFAFQDCYGNYPRQQIAKIYFQLGRVAEAEGIVRDLVQKGVPEAQGMLDEVIRARKFIEVSASEKIPTDAIVFSCPPQSAYPFDELLYKSKGMGGSETALIEMATRLKRLTNRPVIVFNDREHDMVGPSGVEWRSVKSLPDYFSKFKPHTHIAWRHNIKVTDAKTYLWCHDLTTGTVESQHNFDYHLCLSQFHSNYVQAMQGVPKDKIIVTRNGINPEKFNFERKPKNPNKVVFMSSPDRGLERAMLVVDRMREVLPELELHVYYGLENLYKYGLGELADKLKAMMAERPWVKYHGFTEQRQMYRDVSDAVLWCHPATFIETFAITALEMLALGIYPVTRRLGALQNTLHDAVMRGQSTLFDSLDLDEYAAEGIRVIEQKLYEKVNLDLAKHSWEAVAQEWVDMMGL